MRRRLALLAVGLMLPVVGFALVVLYAIYFPPANPNVGWSVIYGSFLIGAALAAAAQRGRWQKVAAAGFYLAAAYGVLWFTALLIACRVFGDCP